jgi:hypothetical protein
MKALVSIPLEAMDSFVGCLPGDSETLCQFGYGSLVQLVVFEEFLSLFRHGNTFLRHGFNLLQELSATHVLIIFCNQYPGLVQECYLANPGRYHSGCQEGQP